MMGKRKVPIENIFYMFSYVWDRVGLLDEKLFDNDDDFSSTDILASIFLKNVIPYLSTGMYREYLTINEELRGIKGKVDFKSSLNNLSFENAKAFCDYDELLENNNINKIIKTTAYKLYNLDDIRSDLKIKLNNILLRFNKVDIQLSNEKLDVKFNRNNYYTYEMIKICELINEMTIISEKKGEYKFFDVFENDEKLAKLFELFVFRFYKSKEKEMAKKVSFQNQMSWNLEGVEKNWLPRMELDILIEDKEEVIIIDTKYYKNFYKADLRFEQVENNKLRPSHLYQIFAYINNFNTEKKLSGMLLYPKSYTGETADFNYQLNRVSNEKIEVSEMRIKTIDLNQNWKIIEEDLVSILR